MERENSSELPSNTPKIIFLSKDPLIQFQAQRLVETVAKQGIFEALGYSAYVRYPNLNKRDSAQAVEIDFAQAVKFISEKSAQRMTALTKETLYWENIARQICTKQNIQKVRDICGPIIPETVEIGVVDYAVSGDCSGGKLSILSKGAHSDLKIPKRSDSQNIRLFIHEFLAHLCTYELRQKTVIPEDIRNVYQKAHQNAKLALLLQNSKELLMNLLTAEYLLAFNLEQSFTHQLLGARFPPTKLKNSILSAFYKEKPFQNKANRKQLLRHPGNIQRVIEQVDMEILRFIQKS
ncbi:MAG: hypothetical protein GF381_00795 [Candidatus Pacebacteria bacterium]|nr:hypothetical protein [Candidatus Paceibacterota bacterium]